MSWGDIFFGFRGRINRKTYWIAGIVVSIAGFLFNALLAYLATGNPIAPEIWERAADKVGVWVPVWIAYFAFLAWPMTALSVKRLHDRNRPAWLWYAYYALCFALTLIPAKATAQGQTNAALQILLIPLGLFMLYLFFELGVLRGTVGRNAHGEDTLPAGYYGGDYSFWSLMFALEGRISRAKWWRGIVVLIGVMILTSLLISAYLARHPELEQLLSDPDRINSPEAEPLLAQLAPWLIIPFVIFAVVGWSFLALGVKRLHDRGLSSWLILVVVLPFLGALISPSLAASQGVVRLLLLLLAASAIWSLLQFGILKGDTGPNDHGPDPLAG